MFSLPISYVATFNRLITPASLILFPFLGTQVAFGAQEGHSFVQDAYQQEAQIEVEADQDKVYDAVQQGLIRPFSELYKTVEAQLQGRLIKIELEEEDEEWVYELKLMYDNNVIEVEYNATTLEMMALKGRHLYQVIKK